MRTIIFLIANITITWLLARTLKLEALRGWDLAMVMLLIPALNITGYIEGRLKSRREYEEAIKQAEN